MVKNYFSYKIGKMALALGTLWYSFYIIKMIDSMFKKISKSFLIVNLKLDMKQQSYQYKYIHIILYNLWFFSMMF